MQGTTNRRTWWGIVAAGITAAAFVHALNLAQRLWQTSDSTQSFVAAHAIVGGNILLTGWHFPFNDYYFTDTLPYAALEWVAGPHPFLLALVPALTYALFVLAALLASIRPQQSVIRNLEACAVVVLVLAAPGWIGRWDPLLLSGMHVGTVLLAFVALALVARIAESDLRYRWEFICAGGALVVLTAATIASDPFCLVFAFGPALAVLAVDMAVRRHAPRLAFLLLAGGIALGLLLPQAIAFVGGFTTQSDVLTGFTATLDLNLLAMVLGLFALFGIVPLSAHAGFLALLALFLRVTSLAFCAIAVVRVVFRFFGRAALFDRLLCAGILTVLAACAVSAQFAKGIAPDTMWSGGPPMRYLMPAVLFAAVLAGRQIPQILATETRAQQSNVVRGLLVLFAALILLGGGWLSAVDSQPGWIANNPPAGAARWLAEHRLTQGVGEYWSANLVTAMSGNAVEVRSVLPDSARLVPYVWVEDARWYAQAPQFAIWQEPNRSGITAREVLATFPVCRIASVAGYNIAVIAAPRHAPSSGPTSRSRFALCM